MLQNRESGWQKRVFFWGGQVARLILSVIFIFAGWAKLEDPTLFAMQVRHYDLLPDPWVALVALFLPWLEIACGVGLWWRRLQGGALLGLTGMILIFLLALISAWSRGLNIDCGCFGEAVDRGAYAGAVVMDLLLLLLVGSFWIGNNNAKKWLDA
ncbi:MAG: hypothetical protein L3J39_10660 [Verrucomicrobiales bacterium]|nr:hypothetical protein [Verrucomicrobiales bacterium]